MAHHSKDATSESALLTHVRLDKSSRVLQLLTNTQPRTVEIAQKPGRLLIGAERDLCQICQAVVEVSAQEAVDSEETTQLETVVETEVESVESAGSDSPRETERFATSETGSERAHCHQHLSKSVHQEREDVHAQTTVLGKEVSERHLVLHGERDDHRTRKVQDLRAASSKSAQLLREPQLLLTRIANGAQRCDLTHQHPKHQLHPVMEAKHLHLQPQQLPCQLVVLS